MVGGLIEYNQECGRRAPTGSEKGLTRGGYSVQFSRGY
jgi:hypothetical protein